MRLGDSRSSSRSWSRSRSGVGTADDPRSVGDAGPYATRPLARSPRAVAERDRLRPNGARVREAEPGGGERLPRHPHALRAHAVEPVLVSHRSAPHPRPARARPDTPTPAIVITSWISPAAISASTSSRVAQRIARSSVGSGAAAPATRPSARNSAPRSSVTELETVIRHSCRHAVASKPVSSRSSRRAPSSQRLALVDAALGDLPAVLVERVPVLPDEQQPPVVAHCDHAHGARPEVDDAVDAGAAVRAVDLVVEDAEPRVLVRDPARAPAPRPDADGTRSSARRTAGWSGRSAVIAQR